MHQAMPASPSRLGYSGENEIRSYSRSSHGRKRSRSRSLSRSRRSDRRVRQSLADGQRRERAEGMTTEREREEYERDYGRDYGGASKSHRSDYGEDRGKKRSYSPGEHRDSGKSSHHHDRHHHRHRRDSPSHHHHHHHRHRSPKHESPAVPKDLPFNARQLTRSDLAAFRPLFAYYLDLQKTLDIFALDDTEVRGRWKSFVGKWNRGELAEGWYDPGVFQRAVEDYGDVSGGGGGRRGVGSNRAVPGARDAEDEVSGRGSSRVEGGGDEDDDEDDYGPPPPPAPGQQHTSLHHTPLSSSTTTTTRGPGPSIPTQTDLTLRDEALATARESALTQHRLSRRAHRAEQKALLDEALPRADAGTRERRLEKRKELNEKLKSFREKSPGLGDAMPEGELMGGSGDAVEEYKAMVRAREERKKERVSRREEVERARRAEREERVRGYREREEKVVEGLRELARARFGSGN